MNPGAESPFRETINESIMAFARGDTNLAIAKQAALDDLTSAEQMKAKGNDDLMKGKMLVGHRAGEELLTSACKWYAKALEIVPLSRSLTEHGEEILARKNRLHTSLLLNLALASILCEEWDTVLNCTDTILRLDPKNTKALYRATRAYLELGELEEAVGSISLAIELAPKNRDIQKLADRVEEACRETTELLDQEEGVCYDISTLLARAGISASSSLFEYGKVLRDYAWGQTRSHLHIYIPFAAGLPLNCVTCQITRSFIDVLFLRHPTGGARRANETTARIAGDLYAPVLVDESTWMVTVPGLLHLELLKESTSSIKLWKCIFKHEDEIEIDADEFGSDIDSDEESFDEGYIDPSDQGRLEQAFKNYRVV